MRREFVRDGVIYGGATLLASLSNVALVAVYTRGLEQSAYGVVEYVTVMQLLIQIVVGLELTQAIARYYGGAETDAERRSYASTGFWVLVFAYGVVCAGLFVAADLVEPALFGGVQTGILRPAVVAIYLAILFTVVRGQLRWELRAMRYAVASFVALFVTVALSTYLLLVLRTGVVGVFAATAVGNGVGIASCLIGLRRTYEWSFDAALLRTMLAFSLPLTLSSVALLAANYGDRVVVRAVMGFGDLGVYAAGAKVAGVISLASAGFQLGAAPLIYRNHKRPDTPETLAQLLRLFSSAGLVGVIGLAAVSLEVVGFFVAPPYAEAWRVVAVLALATVLASGYIFLPGLSLRNMTSLFAAISVVTAGASLLLIGILASVLGIVGAALGALGGAGLGFLLHAIASQRTYAIPIEWWRIVTALGIALAAIVVAWMLGVPSLPFLLARVVLLAVASGAVLMILLTSDDRSLIGRALLLPLRSVRIGSVP